MGFFSRLKEGLQKTHSKLVHEIKRIVTLSPKLTSESAEDLEEVLLGADLGVAMTEQIMTAVKKSYETQGSKGVDVFGVARGEIEKALGSEVIGLKFQPSGLTVISIVGVNGTGKTTTSAKLAYWLTTQKKVVQLAACDTFRAAAIEQLDQWAQRLGIPIIKGQYKADPAAVCHDAWEAAKSRGIQYLICDTAGRLHNKENLMGELSKIERVLGRKDPDAPHETLLVVDATTGSNALVQAREFQKATGQLTGVIVTKLDGSGKGGVIVSIQQELGIPARYIGTGESQTDFEVFDSKTFAESIL